MKYGIQLRPGSFKEILDQTLMAEKLGFDDVWYPDHLIYPTNPQIEWHELFVVLSYLVLHTKKINIASGVTDILRRNPAIIAQGFCSLDQLSRGRMILGIGAGEAMNLEICGIIEKAPVTKLDEGLKLIEELWKKDNETFKIKPKRIPIYIAGYRKRMLKLTKDHGDGWLPVAITPEEYSNSLRNILPIERSFDPTIVLSTLVSRNIEEAEKEMLPKARRNRYILTKLGYFNWSNSKEQNLLINEESKLIPKNEALRSVLLGNPTDIDLQIEEFAKKGCKHVVFGIGNKDNISTIKILGEEFIKKEKRIGDI